MLLRTSLKECRASESMLSVEFVDFLDASQALLQLASLLPVLCDLNFFKELVVHLLVSDFVDASASLSQMELLDSVSSRVIDGLDSAMVLILSVLQVSDADAHVGQGLVGPAAGVLRALARPLSLVEGDLCHLCDLLLLVQSVGLHLRELVIVQLATAVFGLGRQVNQFKDLFLVSVHLGRVCSLPWLLSLQAKWILVGGD